VSNDKQPLVYQGRQIVIYGLAVASATEYESDVVYRYLIDGRNASLCYSTYTEALKAAQREVELLVL
jgi:hypothetical protein